MSKDHSKEHASGPEVGGTKPHDDDVVVVPKGSSKARFLMTALLAMLVLTTFTVSDEVVGCFTGKNQASSYMSWTHPVRGAKTWKVADFYVVKQNLDKVYTLLQGGRKQSEVRDEDTALFIIQDELSRDAGVHVTNEEIRRIILGSFGTGENYRQALANYRMSAREFEETTRAIMRVHRYETMLAAAFAVPDPAELEKRWKFEHNAFTLDYVDLPTERSLEAARAALPGDDELKKWFEELPEHEKTPFKTAAEPTRSAEFAYYPLEGTPDPAGVLAKYPRPPGEDAEQVARTYYEAWKDRLFLRPEAPVRQVGQPYPPEDIQPFEAVRDTCLRDGPVMQSMIDWLESMKQREEKGERVLLVDEATSLGLAYRQEIEPRGRAQWMQIQMPWKGIDAVEAMFERGEVKRFLPDVVVDAKAILVGRVLALQDARLPAYEEIRDKVRDAWAKKKAGEIALAKLEALHATFPMEADPFDPATQVAVEPDGEKFAAAAKQAELELKTFADLDPRTKPRVDQRGPLDLFLRRIAARYGIIKVGVISKPELSPDRASAWMARIASKREGDSSRMAAGDLQSMSEQAARQARFDFVNSTFRSPEFMKARYGLDLAIWRKEPDASQAPASGGSNGKP